MFYLALLSVVIGVACASSMAVEQQSGLRVQPPSNASRGNADMNVTLYLMNRDAFEAKVLPAVRAFTASGDVDRLLALLQDARHNDVSLDDDMVIVMKDFELYTQMLQEFKASGRGDINMLQKWGTKQRPLAAIVTHNMAPDLIEVFCLVRADGRVLKKEMSRASILPYLYAHSPWIEKLFTLEISTGGGPLELEFGESSEIIGAAETQRLYEEIAAIPAPAELEVQRQLRELRALIESASRDPRLCLLMTVS
jgi:hypothetical protein